MDFQVASFTHVAMSKQELCRVCPGACVQPSVLVLPTFVLMSCLFAVGAFIVAYDVYHKHNPRSFVSPVQDRLLEASAVPNAAAVDARSSLSDTITAFCARYSRGMVETCSAYVLVPCTFVFVLNLRPSSFDHADAADRAMIVMLPMITLLLRALVIRQRVVHLTAADQKQLFVGSVCSCLIAAVLSLYFQRVEGAHEASQSFSSQTSPQYIVLALLAVQVVAQTVIRVKAVEESFFDNLDWPWSTARSQESSAVFTFDELATRLVTGSIKSASLSAVSATAKFVMLNHVPLSQMAMVTVGVASSIAISPASIETSSIAIGCIPLISSGVLLLHNVVKFVSFLLRYCCRQRTQAGARRSERDSNY